MRAQILQHVPFEGPGSIGPWLEAAGYRLEFTRLFAGERLPAVDQFELLVVMGGPMSVNDEAEFPWLAAEKRFVRDCITVDKPVLGICLGAQLIAAALGARVYPNQVKEIGWFPIQGRSEPPAGCFGFPPQLEVFHWHGETFTLPEGAQLLASSEGCTHQAFQLGSAIGLQFHLETTPEQARALVEHCRDELVPGPYIQDEARILAAAPETYAAINRLMGEVLSHLHAKAG